MNKKERDRLILEIVRRRKWSRDLGKAITTITDGDSTITGRLKSLIPKPQFQFLPPIIGRWKSNQPNFENWPKGKE